MKRILYIGVSLLAAATLSTSAFAAEPEEPAPAPAPAAEPAPAPAPAAEAMPSEEVTDEATEEEGEGEGDEFAYERGGLAGVGLSLGFKVGGGFGQLTSPFGAGVAGEFELGYNFPVLDRMLGLTVAVSYAGPTTEGSAPADSRLPGDGIMTYEIVQHQIILTAALIVRIPVGTPMFRPYLQAGWRAYFMQSVINGKAGGEDFGENTEDSSSYGGAYGSLGFELHFGDAGALALEIQWGWTAVDQYVLRDTNLGSLNTVLAYRIFL